MIRYSALVGMASGLALLVAGARVMAIEPIPKQSGFSGYISIGVAAANYKTNMVAAIRSINLDSRKTDSINSGPEDKNVALPAAAFELSYTFASTETQLFVGNLLEDYLRFDLTTLLGIRQEVGELGTFSVAMTRSPFPTRVWEDPYIAGQKRVKTNRTGKGIRVIWGNIFQTPLEVRLTTQDISIDNERSGEALNLDQASRRLLDRNGDLRRAELLYDVNLGGGNHLIPSISLVESDLDGRAMANSGYKAQLAYHLNKAPWRLVGNLAFGQTDAKHSNPIYSKKNNTDAYGVSLTVFYTKPFGLEGWAINAGISYYDENSNIDFYDSKLTLFSVGVLYRFN